MKYGHFQGYGQRFTEAAAVERHGVAGGARFSLEAGASARTVAEVLRDLRRISTDDELQMENDDLHETSESPSTETTAAVQFMQHYGFVRAMAVRYAPWPGLAEDVFQQVFLEFLQGRERWEVKGDVRSVLATMTQRIALRYWKQSLKGQSELRQRLAEYIRLAAEVQDTHEAWQEESDALRACLKRLPQESRQLLDLYYFQEVPTETIGERFSMKPETVRRVISRLRETLRECIRLTLIQNPRHV